MTSQDLVDPEIKMMKLTSTDAVNAGDNNLYFHIEVWTMLIKPMAFRATSTESFLELYLIMLSVRQGETKYHF